MTIKDFCRHLGCSISRRVLGLRRGLKWIHKYLVSGIKSSGPVIGAIHADNSAVDLGFENQLTMSLGGVSSGGQLENPTQLSIIIPVYNASVAFAECAQSLINHTPKDVDVIIVNDFSSEASVEEIIHTIQSSFLSTQVIRNSQNLGFTKSINIGLKAAAGRDVIILNSDTVVTERWVQKLKFVAYSHSQIATVTPISNNAGVFSVPEASEANWIPCVFRQADYARCIEQVGSGVPLIVPTGHGFCMYITWRSRSVVGELDEQLFPRGYGEENDFCMRARENGFINVVTNKVYIFHKSGQSFKEEKPELLKAGLANLLSKHPTYFNHLGVFDGPEFSKNREDAKGWLLESLGVSRTRVLLVNSSPCEKSIEDLSSIVKLLSPTYDCYSAEFDNQEIRFYKYSSNTGLILTDGVFREDSLTSIHGGSEDFSSELFDFVFRNSIDIVQELGPLPSQNKLDELVGLLGVSYFANIEEACGRCGKALLRSSSGVTCLGCHSLKLEAIPRGAESQILQTSPQTSRATFFQRHFAKAQSKNRRKLFMREFDRP